MILRKKVGLIAMLMSVVLIIAFMGNIYEPLKETSAAVLQKPQIILDAGHGGLTNTIN